MPTVNSFMTRDPYSVASTDSLQRAHSLMHRHSVRHLPVVDGKQLVGIIGDRDVAAVCSIPGVDLAHVEVSRVMEQPLDVRSEAQIDEVALLMAERRRDCVVVRGASGIEGIFTSTDALRALAALARTTNVPARGLLSERDDDAASG